jgi:ABC-2 type transport system permease protein
LTGRRPSALRGFAAGVLLFAYQLRRSPETLIWYVGFPLILLLVARAVFLGGPEPQAVGVAGPSWAAGALEEAGFDVKLYGSVSEGLEDLARGRIAALVVEGGGLGVRVLYLYPHYRGAAFGAAQALALASGLEPPVPVERAVGVEALATPERALAFYSFNVIGVQALYIALYGGMVTLVSMRRDGSLKLAASSPGGGRALMAFLAGYSLSAATISSAAVLAAAAAMGADFSGMSLSGAAAAALLVAAGLASVFLAAIPLSLVIAREESAAALAGVTGFLTMFLAGLAVPRESLPGPLAAAAALFPITAAVEAGREAVLGLRGPLEALASAPQVYAALLLAAAAGSAAYRRLISRAVEE